MNELKNICILITGIVQGVGFRPFVYRMAVAHNIKGYVINNGTCVVVEAEGEQKDLHGFLEAIKRNRPKLSRINDISVSQGKYIGYESFNILKSRIDTDKPYFIPQDISMCNNCMADIKDPLSGRYRYAFTNCSDCGPRYSIIKSLPYDKVNTSMIEFEMCDNCKKEYDDPLNRRFHAQGNCCPVCGPFLKILDSNGEEIECTNPLDLAVSFLKEGKIGAIKGIGGYHLCCSALNNKAVNELRKRKRRPDRPLAVMAKDVEAVKKICVVTQKETDVLISVKRPIVLLNKKEDNKLAYSVAPRLRSYGIMLPYTPLHYLLFDESMEYLVMTSGNISGRPICYKDEDALCLLKDVADFFLVHNRKIQTPIDDSVVKVIKESETISRLSRGYAPLTINIDSNLSLIATGAEQKSSVVMTKNGYGYVSQYIGDLKSYDSYKAYVNVIGNFKSLFNSNPDIYVHDLNPDYLSTRYANEQKGTKIEVQHHHAHMVSCMAENGLKDNCIGVIFDGTGLGTDGAVWGGEFFTGNLKGFHREGHLNYVSLQGGDKVIKQPWRSAAGYLHESGLNPCDILESVDEDTVKKVIYACDKKLNCFLSSSMGRFFDCVAAMTNLRTVISYDAQGAIELENVCDDTVKDYYNYEIYQFEGELILDYSVILSEIVKDIQKERHVSIISAKFHNTIVLSAADIVKRIHKKTGFKDVVLSGGCFENKRLFVSLIQTLKSMGLNPYLNTKIPANDGGISLGQAVAAVNILRS